MNARQAAKAASLRIAEMERVAALNKQDIIDYNACILGIIDGKSPCEWCEDLEDCLSGSKDVSTGCANWMLRFHKQTETETEEHEQDHDINR